jgi:hypothetical protein
MKKFITKQQNKKIAQFLVDNEQFNEKFMSMTKEEQMVAIKILKAII